MRQLLLKVEEVKFLSVIWNNSLLSWTGFIENQNEFFFF